MMKKEKIRKEKRMSIVVNAQVYREVKSKAALEGLTVSKVVRDLLEMWLKYGFNSEMEATLIARSKRTIR